MKQQNGAAMNGSRRTIQSTAALNFIELCTLRPTLNPALGKALVLPEHSFRHFAGTLAKCSSLVYALPRLVSADLLRMDSTSVPACASSAVIQAILTVWMPNAGLPHSKM